MNDVKNLVCKYVLPIQEFERGPRNPRLLPCAPLRRTRRRPFPNCWRPPTSAFQLLMTAHGKRAVGRCQGSNHHLLPTIAAPTLNRFILLDRACTYTGANVFFAYEGRLLCFGHFNASLRRGDFQMNTVSGRLICGFMFIAVMCPLAKAQDETTTGTVASGPICERKRFFSNHLHSL